MFSYAGEKIERVDRLTSTGLFVLPDRLLRLLWVPQQVCTVSELLVYDSIGIERYYRLDHVSDVHDIAWDGENFIVVSTGTNEIVWFSPTGRRVRSWRAPGADDSWHINSLCLQDGRILVSAFGRFEGARQWNDESSDGAGFVFDLATAATVLEGLHYPHTPRWFESGWLICNSKRNELILIDSRDQKVRQRVELDAYPRGIAVADDVIFVGESANRKRPEELATAAVAVVCRKTWRILERLSLPCREIYDLVLVPPELFDGVRRGFATNPVRVEEQDRYALFERQA